MKRLLHYHDPSDLEERANATEAQLEAYAVDFGKLLASERAEARQLEYSNRQLQLYARDLRRALATERARSDELEKAHHDTLLRLLRASRFKDNETASHLRRVRHLSRLLAAHLRWSEEQANLLAEASPMHDVGKIGVPDAILHKPGPLTPEEWKVMRRHPSFGAMLLQGSGSQLLRTAREIALNHHERWNGSGYPRGLVGDKIPSGARIVALVDTYDALRTTRPYKQAFTHDRAREIIQQGDGRTMPHHFEPAVLAAFNDLHEQFEATHARYYH